MARRVWLVLLACWHPLPACVCLLEAYLCNKAWCGGWHLAAATGQLGRSSHILLFEFNKPPRSSAHPRLCASAAQGRRRKATGAVQHCQGVDRCTELYTFAHFFTSRCGQHWPPPRRTGADVARSACVQCGYLLLADLVCSYIYVCVFGLL
eukprot:366330-Chlamydomonas_euryale.AAC.6